MNRIEDKINQITSYLDELQEIAPATFEEYRDSLEKKACEEMV